VNGLEVSKAFCVLRLHGKNLLKMATSCSKMKSVPRCLNTQAHTFLLSFTCFSINL